MFTIPEPSTVGHKRKADDVLINALTMDPGSDASQPKKSRLNVENLEDDLQRLACPFYQHNPSKHTKWTSCAGPGWKTIHRLK
jgi:hypothetical protein